MIRIRCDGKGGVPTLSPRSRTPVSSQTPGRRPSRLWMPTVRLHPPPAASRVRNATVAGPARRVRGSRPSPCAYTERLATASLYLCTDARRERGDLAEFAEAALAGGVDLIQLRDKGSPGEQRFGPLEARQSWKHSRCLPTRPADTRCWRSTTAPTSRSLPAPTCAWARTTCRCRSRETSSARAR